MHPHACTVLHARLSTVLEEQHVLPDCMFGFRPGRTTVDCVAHICQGAWRQQAHRRPLIAGFLDISKAYDNVMRDTLWDIMSIIGIPDAFLNVMQSLYTNSHLELHIPGAGSVTIPQCTGLKQGCPPVPPVVECLLVLAA